MCNLYLILCILWKMQHVWYNAKHSPKVPVAFVQSRCTNVLSIFRESRTNLSTWNEWVMSQWHKIYKDYMSTMELTSESNIAFSETKQPTLLDQTPICSKYTQPWGVQACIHWMYAIQDQQGNDKAPSWRSGPLQLYSLLPAVLD